MEPSLGPLLTVRWKMEAGQAQMTQSPGVPEPWAVHTHRVSWGRGSARARAQGCEKALCPEEAGAGDARRQDHVCPVSQQREGAFETYKGAVEWARGQDPRAPE